MANIILIILCFFLGIFFRRKEIFPLETPRVFNSFIIYISLPALILLHIHEMEFQLSLFALIFMPWILFFFAIFYIHSIGKIFHWDSSLIGALILTSGLGNTSFVGLPMIEAYYGKEFISYGLLIDQGGTFFMLSTLGIFLATKYSQSSSEHLSFFTIIKRIIVFPPFMILILSIFLKVFPYPHWLKELLKMIGNTLTPLALFSVGFQLKLSELKKNQKFLAIGLLYKLILAPILIAIIYSFMKIQKDIYHISIFEAAMGPMITGGIVAMNYHLKPELVSLMLAIGISLSFITLPIFWYFFH